MEKILSKQVVSIHKLILVTIALSAAYCQGETKPLKTPSSEGAIASGQLIGSTEKTEQSKDLFVPAGGSNYELPGSIDPTSGKERPVILKKLTSEKTSDSSKKSTNDNIESSRENFSSEEQRLNAQKRARQQAEQARRNAEEQARRNAEEQARRNAEEQARRNAEEQARRNAEVYTTEIIANFLKNEGSWRPLATRKLKDPKYKPTECTPAEAKQIEWFRSLEKWHQVLKYEEENLGSFRINFGEVFKEFSLPSLPPLERADGVLWDEAFKQEMMVIHPGLVTLIQYRGRSDTSYFFESIKGWGYENDSEVLRRVARLLKFLGSTDCPVDHKEMMINSLLWSGTTCKDAALRGLEQAEQLWRNYILASINDPEGLTRSALQTAKKSLAEKDMFVLMRKFKRSNTWFGEDVEFQLIYDYHLDGVFGLSKKPSLPAYFNGSGACVATFREMCDSYVELVMSEEPRFGIPLFLHEVRNQLGAAVIETCNRAYELRIRDARARFKQVLEELGRDFSIELLRRKLEDEETKKSILNICAFARLRKRYVMDVTGFDDLVFEKCKILETYAKGTSNLVAGTPAYEGVKSLFPDGSFGMLHDTYINYEEMYEPLKNYTTSSSTYSEIPVEERVRLTEAIKFLMEN